MQLSLTSDYPRISPRHHYFRPFNFFYLHYPIPFQTLCTFLFLSFLLSPSLLPISKSIFHRRVPHLLSSYSNSAYHFNHPLLILLSPTHSSQKTEIEKRWSQNKGGRGSARWEDTLTSHQDHFFYASAS